MTDEQFEWFSIVGGMCAEGLEWQEAMRLCRNTMAMPGDIFLWMVDRKEKASNIKEMRSFDALEIFDY
ncbi:MAG: hypothetical protein VB857_00475 [Pirellulaceae bacterium]|jgi:hypothetical protein